MENKETRVETSTIVGAYSFGTQSLFMHTWKTMSNRIVLLAQFDGIYSDMCHGYQVINIICLIQYCIIIIRVNIYQIYMVDYSHKVVLEFE